MKIKKRITAFILVMAMVISTIISTPMQVASKKYYWMSTKTKSYNYVDGAWKVNYTDTITYDSKGYNTKSVSEDSYYHTLTTYSYDKKGNRKERVETRTDKVTNEKTVNTFTFSRKYDKNKNITEWVEYCNGEPNDKLVYSGYKKFKITSSN